jgi:hypothetical protein
MNIIEAEDLVKGLPDQALFQEAQYPSGRIPQFLAVSEVQRRQDMRQRFQATQQGQQATVKDQILQGGIGSTGMAPEMSSAPPMAPQMPPQGGPMPPQMPPPVGMAGGGIAPGGMVYMQEGGGITGALSRIFSMKHQFPGLYDDSGELKPGVATVRDLLTPRRSQFSVISEAKALRDQGRRDEAVALLRSERINPDQVLGGQPPAAAPPAAAPPAAAPPAAAPASFNAMPNQRQSFSLSPNYGMPSPATSNAPQRNAPPRDVVDQGIPAAGAAMNAPRQQAGAGTDLRSILQNMFAPQTRSAEEQDLIDLRKQQIKQGLPAPIDLNQYIQSAQQRQQEARDEARQMAIANTLMNLGTGLFAGDPAAGLQRATQAATETLREGRREAQAEGRMAEQLQLQAAQQNRQNILDTMKFKSEAVGDIANIISGEKKTNRSDQLAAAQILVTYENSLARERAENARQGRTDANSIRAAETSALQQASQYLREHLERTGEEITDQDFATRVRNMANSLNVGGGSSNANRFTVTEAPNKQGG